MVTTKRIVIIAGPNGAGKTTFARDFLPNEADCPDFINADLIAAGLSPFRPETAAVRAGRLMLNDISARVKAGKSFAFETTLSGLAYAQAIPRWQSNGYHVKLMFLTLPNADMAVMRVAARVAQGGHHIPEDVIRRRFDAGLRNFHGLYKSLANLWILYDNSGDEPVIIDAGAKP
jgi:predicted ABC-type ATPase